MFDPSKPPRSLAELAQRAFTNHTASPCLGTKDKASSEYRYASYGEVALRVRHLAGGLAELGLARGERVAILAENSPQWAIADLACQMLGLVSVPLFATLPPVQVQAILGDSGASLVFVSDAKQLKKIESIAAALPQLRFAVSFEQVEGAALPAAVALLCFHDLEKRGDAYYAQRPTEYETTWPAAAPGDPATIIYTSGTTGEPKGVVLSQQNIIANLEAIITGLELSPEDLFLSFLPLAHVYERTAGFFLPLRLGAAIAYCESLFTVDKNLREARPTIMFCVPRLYESMRDKLFAAAQTLPPGQKEKYLEALELARKAGAARGQLAGAAGLSIADKLKYRLYDATVYGKIRDNFGGRMRAFVSGGAPIAPELAALFTGIGLNILEGYGLTETSPVISVNRPHRVRLGTVGELMSCVRLKFAEDGEILVQGDSVFNGYWNKPGATAEAIIDGWFHTGDIGELDDGYLRITDRKKDLLVLANGKKVAPAPIELRLGTSLYIKQVVLLGDKAKAVSALVVPDITALRETIAQNDLPEAADLGDEALLQSPQALALIRAEVESHSGDLADYERIRNIKLLPQEFTVEAGELTPTLKIKRAVVAAKYTD